MPANPIVHVVEDEALVRDFLLQLFHSVGLECRTYASASEFLQEYEAQRTGCILADVRLPGMSGLELQEQLKALSVSVPIVIMTAYADVATATRAMRNGAFDFVEKPFNPQVLLDSVSRALRIGQQVAERASKQARVESRLALLSPREREILGLVLAGRPSKQIASALGLSHKTVENHRASIMHKMAADGVVQLVRMCLLANVPVPDDTLLAESASA